MNSFSIIGRLTKKPELRYTSENKAITKIDMAIRNGKDDTTFLPITIFGKQGENVEKYCDKGSLIAVNGKIYNNNYEDKEGNRHYGYNFIGHTIEFLSNKGNYTTEDKKSVTEAKNESKEEDVFAEFGDSIEMTESDIAF